MVGQKQRSKEYFAESEYGVKASPRVSNLRTRLPRGGGREQIGKPYQVRGKWYHPKEDRSYRKVGTASWYGDAFHGRLTANGEIYDMTHLTAAHPTMPLPSYARVTNTANNSSVIVRVNDRGPFSDGRIIDLSKRAAEMLDYTHSGTAKVKVEYVGRAPLHGQDDGYLVASYDPGNRATDPSVGLPAGVMIAMNGATPTAPLRAEMPAAFPGELVDTAAPVAVAFADGADGLDLALPDLGPIAPERPAGESLPVQVLVASAEMSYAGERTTRAASAFDLVDRTASLTEQAKSPEWQSQGLAHQGSTASGPFVAVGTYGDPAMALDVAMSLSELGRVRIEQSENEGTLWHSVNLYPLDGTSIDELLQAAWAQGSPEAFVVRN